VRVKKDVTLPQNPVEKGEEKLRKEKKAHPKAVQTLIGLTYILPLEKKSP